MPLRCRRSNGEPAFLFVQQPNRDGEHVEGFRDQFRGHHAETRLIADGDQSLREQRPDPNRIVLGLAEVSYDERMGLLPGAIGQEQ